MSQDHAQLAANHERFVTTILETEVVLAIKGETGFGVCESNDVELHDGQPASVLLFLSHEPYARRVIDSEFSGHVPEEISLFDFLFRWLPGMAGDGFLAGTNFTGSLHGLASDAHELQEELMGALPKLLACADIDRMRAERGD